MNVKAAYYSVLAVLAAAGTVVAEALGGWDTALQTLVILMAIDYLTGLLCALIWRKSPKTESGAFESKASIKGLIRKGAVLLVVYIAAQLDRLMGTDAARLAVIMFFIANDGLSIVENLGIMGVPMPEVVKNAFALLRQQSEPHKPDEPEQTVPNVLVDEKDQPAENYEAQAEAAADPDEPIFANDPARPSAAYAPKHASDDSSDSAPDLEG